MIFNKKELTTLCQTATEAAIAAGQYIQSEVDQHQTKQHKTGGTSLASQVVTTVDLKAQEIILRHLQKSIADYDLGLLTEEASDDQSRALKSYFWCIDPLDGTLPFTEGKTGYCVSIALVTTSGDPVVGVVYVPDLAACYTSIKGEGVQLNEELCIYDETAPTDTLHVYLDRSLQSEAYFHTVTSLLEEWAEAQKILHIQYHAGFGAVRNAIGVMTSGTSCYFKFPKEQRGGGSIWDYASTRLFFEELGLPVSNAEGCLLHLNNPNSTFMNEVGIVYATDPALSKFIIEMGHQVV